MFEMPTIEKAKIKSNITSYWSTLDKQISSLSFCLMEHILNFCKVVSTLFTRFSNIDQVILRPKIAYYLSLAN